MPLSLPFLKRTGNSDVYFGLFIKEAEVIGFIFENRLGRLELVAEEKSALTNGWDNLIEDIDEMIFSLEQKTKKHLDKVIFFVYSHFIDQNTKEMKKTYLPMFKDIVKHLELKPMGYIECFEAVASYFEKKDQSPLTAILVELDKTNLGVFVYKGGHKSFIKNMSRTENIVDDLEAVFNDVRGDLMLPSRIILYDSYNLHDESTTILSHKWNSELFVQYPRVEILNPDKLHKGLMNIFESQINSNNFPVVEEKETEEKKEVLGFAIGEEVEPEKEDFEERTGIEHKARSAIKLPKFKLLQLSLLGNFLSAIKGRMPSFSGQQRFSKSYLTVAAGIILIFIALFSIEYFFHKANLNIMFPSKQLSKTLDLQMTLGEVSDDSFKINQETMTADLSEKKETTGKREVGEKARGEVTIYNFGDRDRLFNKGTALETNGIKFVLSEDVKVASASEAGGNLVSGKGKAKVEAVNFGTEGNIDKNQKFKVAELTEPSYARNDTAAFTGGTKKQVKTVAKQDIENLKALILKKAKEQAIEKLRAESKTGEELLDDLTVTELDKIELSKETGEEADQLTLTATANTNYYTYSPTEVRSFLQKSFQGEVSSGFKLNEDKITFELNDAEIDEDEISVNVVAKTKLMKDIVNGDIAGKIAGKKKNDIEQILKKDFQASGYEIRINSPIFFFENWLPFFKKNISLTISSL